MNPFALLNKYYWSLRYPAREPYVQMGFGIRNRARDLSKFWAPHLRCSKEFQRAVFEPLSRGGSVAVLGAGALLDVDIELLGERFDTIRLYDADPSLALRWRRLAGGSPARFEYHCVDLSGCFDTWRQELKSFLAETPTVDAGGLSAFLRALAVSRAHPKLARSDAVLSANLLGQIPLYWRDVVHAEVLRCWDLDTNDEGEFEADLQAALLRSMTRLQESHLELLAESGARRVALITDRSFMYYRRDISEWQCHDAIHMDSAPSLAGYTQIAQDSWLWHLKPQGYQGSDYGEIHEVAAFGFART